MPAPQIYEFNDFRLDAAKRLLLRRGEPVSVTPRVFDTLLYLVQHQGRVLEKDELMRAIWPDAFVEENNLTQNISTLRQMLGENRGENRYIVTVPGHGYRFAAAVKTTAAAVKTTIAYSETLSTLPDKTIAVLAFDNMSADPENEYFCDGLAEELLNALAKVEGLKVVARTSAFSFKGKNVNVGEIGEALGVNTVLEGSVRKSGNRLRITVQLINASDGYHLWSERYDRELRDIFDVQDEITLAVVDALKVKLLGEEKAAVLKRYTDNTEAYVLYLKGIYYRWKLTPEEFGKCRECFQQAINLDPSFALAYFGLASYYGYGTAWGLLPIPPHEGWLKAQAAITKVLELDNTLPEVHLTVAAFKLVNHRDWDAAGQEIESIASLNPKFPEIHHLYSFYLLAVGRFDDAIAEAQCALELDPLSLRYSHFLGTCFYYARRYDEATGQFNQALELDPNNALAHESLGEVFARKEMFGEAIAAWQRAMTLTRDDELAEMLSHTYAEADFTAAVRAVARKRIERMSERAESGEFLLAIGYARASVMLGDEEQALHWLEKACEERNVFPLLMSSDPFYDSLRPDPRFEDLQRRVGFMP